jgi:hypothetical protein
MDWVVYGPDDEVPADHAALITNPKAWEGGKLQSTEGDSSKQDSGSEATDSGANPDEPPRSGKGSSKEAWAEFAQSRGVHVEDEDSRDDIIAALVEAGVVQE